MKEEILVQNASLKCELVIPERASGLIVFVCIKGIKCNDGEELTNHLNAVGLGTLRVDVLNNDESKHRNNLTDLGLLTERLIGITKWCSEAESLNRLNLGYFGIGIGSAVALSAAAYWGTKIKAVVSWKGRPDLVLDELDLIEAPTLLIVGKDEQKMIEHNRKAYLKIGNVKKMEIVDESLEKVSKLAENWFCRFLLGESMEERVPTISKKN